MSSFNQHSTHSTLLHVFLVAGHFSMLSASLDFCGLALVLTTWRGRMLITTSAVAPADNGATRKLILSAVIIYVLVGKNGCGAHVTALREAGRWGRNVREHRLRWVISFRFRQYSYTS